MKRRLLLLICSLFVATNLYAQRIAVLDFDARVGVSRADVDGISSIFNTYFSPRGYTLVERAQIDRVIEEQNFQRGKFTQEQMVRIGEILNVSKVVMGTVNVIRNQYNVDVRVVNVESGTISATDGATWNPNIDSYRDMMQNLATRLADKISIIPIAKKPVVRARESVETVLGYLKVYPTELGVFPSVPTTVIAQINKQHMYDYDSWRIPTEEELELLRANKYLGSNVYMSTSSANSSGIVLLVTDSVETYSQKMERLEKERKAAEERAIAAGEYRKRFRKVQTGFGSMLNIGNTIKCWGYDWHHAISLTYTAGYRFNNQIFLGAGVGINFNTTENNSPMHLYYVSTDYNINEQPIVLNPRLVSVPVYIYFRANFINRRCSPFFALAAGGNLSGKQTLNLNLCQIKYSTSGLFVNPQLGVNLRMTVKSSIYLAVGFNGFTVPYCECYTSYNAEMGQKFMPGMDFHLGFTF